MRAHNDPKNRVNFGGLPPLPDGWVVTWVDNEGPYFGVGPEDIETYVTWNRFWARRWLLEIRDRYEIYKNTPCTCRDYSCDSCLAGIWIFGAYKFKKEKRPR